MATLMEFASSSLDRDGSSRVAPGAAPHLGLMPPVLHWGSAARDVLDQSGKRCVKLFVMATKGCATRALDMAVESTSLCKEGMLILDELSMRGSSVSSDTPLDSGICSLWGTAQNGGVLILSLGSAVSAWRGHAIATTILANIAAERVVILDELSLRDCAIDTDLEDLDEDLSLIRKLPTDAELQRLADAVETDMTQRCPTLESGVVVDGVAAATLTALQLQNLSAVLYVGLSKEAPGGARRCHTHEDPSYPLASILRAELSRAGMAEIIKKTNGANSAPLVPSADFGNLYL